MFRTAVIAALMGLAACSSAPESVDAGGCADGSPNGEPSTTQTCIGSDDAGCTAIDAICCAGTATCPTSGGRLVTIDEANRLGCVYLNLVAGCP
ncbi:MAG: hypothetical protein JST54_22325 [Deltaproteobacteria bacterium]|nr:hypothetical protein [Deltaproteobacteria bacterium]